MLSVQVKGLDQARAMIRYIPAETEKAAGVRLGKAAQILVKFWKITLSGPRSGSRLGVVSGALRSSISAVRLDKLTVAVGTWLPYARIHEFGGQTRPHTITARAAKALRFVIGGVVVFARSVHHPGSKMPRRPHRAPAMRLADHPMRLTMGGAAKEGAELARRKARAIREVQRDLAQR
jgi:phage gpG-like protein